MREEAAKEKAGSYEKARKALKLKSLCHLPPVPKPKRKKKPKEKSKEPAFNHAKPKATRARRKRG
jgi:hypothetical protein